MTLNFCYELFGLIELILFSRVASALTMLLRFLASLNWDTKVFFFCENKTMRPQLG